MSCCTKIWRHTKEFELPFVIAVQTKKKSFIILFEQVTDGRKSRGDKDEDKFTLNFNRKLDGDTNEANIDIVWIQLDSLKKFGY